MRRSLLEEAALISRPALAVEDWDRGEFRLETVPQGHILQALAALDIPDAVDRLASIAEDKPYAVRPNGPRQWLIVGDEIFSRQALREKRFLLGEQIVVLDQSHGRVRFGASGFGVRWALAKGCGVDFSAGAFPVGNAATTLFCGIGVHITRTEEDRIELIVLLSFAQSLWAVLTQ
jgi:sarcosine oxidase, subunit gamma